MHRALDESIAKGGDVFGDGFEEKGAFFAAVFAVFEEGLPGEVGGALQAGFADRVPIGGEGFAGRRVNGGDGTTAAAFFLVANQVVALDGHACSLWVWGDGRGFYIQGSD